MHTASVSSCSISPRCHSARNARAGSASRSAVSSAGQKRSGDDANTVCDGCAGDSAAAATSLLTCRPTSSSRRTDIFFLTRPSSGAAPRPMVVPLDVTAVEEMRLQQALRQQTKGKDYAKSPSQEPLSKKLNGDEWKPTEDPVAECVSQTQAVSSSWPSPFTILRQLRNQSSNQRRPSRVPTPPAIPDINTIVSSGLSQGGRRPSLFPRHSLPSSSVTSPSQNHIFMPTQPATSPGSRDFDNPDFLTAMSSNQEFHFLSEISRSERDVEGGCSHSLTVAEQLREEERARQEGVANPGAVRRRIACGILNDIALTHAGVQLTVPYIPQLPHYQSLHSIESIREVVPSELPLALRVAHTQQDSLLQQAPCDSNRGFLTAKQWKRLERATNFVFPVHLSNAGCIDSR